MQRNVADHDPTDDDLAAMYLTDKKNGLIRELDDHEELEVLLEFFSKQVEEIVNEAENIEVNVAGHLMSLSNANPVVKRAIYPRNSRANIRFESQRLARPGPQSKHDMIRYLEGFIQLTHDDFKPTRCR